MSSSRINLAAALAITLGAAALSSCNNDEPQKVSVTYTYNFETSEQFTAEGYWTEVYNTGTEYKILGIPPQLKLTHSAVVETYDGVDYKSWFGFCPSRSTDNADHSGDDWTKYQWGSITGGGQATTDYMLACWATDEPTDRVLADNEVSVGIGFDFPSWPMQVSVTNSAWGYWAMKNGTAFNHAFGPDDWCRVTFIGVKNGKQTARVSVDLASNGQILNTWLPVDLSPLGEVDYFYAQMSSSDSGVWGMNNPAYFCIDNLSIKYVGYNY